MTEKIYRPGDPTAPAGAKIIRPEQEAAIVRMMAEPTHAIVNASNMDTGKTLQASEFIVRMGFVRTLTIGVKDTYAQWADRLAAQSDGKITMRRIDSTKAGQQAMADFRAGKAGHYFVGSQFLTTQDWEHRPVTDDQGRPVWKVQKSTSAVVTKPAPMEATMGLWEDTDEKGKTVLRFLPNPQIGPQLLPVQETERHHKRIYARVKPLDLIVFDEIHMVANRKAIGRRTLGTIRTDWKLAMSGTWVGNKFENAWSITRWAYPTIIDTSFHRWKDVYCATKTDKVSKTKEVESITGEKEPGAFVATLPCYIRIDGELEVPAPEIVWVDLTPAQREQYDDLEADLLVWLKKQNAMGRHPLAAELPITLRQRLRTATLGEMILDEDGQVGFEYECKSAKLGALRGILDYWGNQAAAIYVDSKKFAKVTVARMRAAGYNAVEWSGDIPSKQRDQIKADFLAGKIQYIVAVITAFSTGLDGFQAVCNKIVWLSESENNMQNNQAVKRFFRTGRKEGFQHVKILARDTLDQGIFGRNVAETLEMNQTLSLQAAA
jgi:hypothetical protein